MKSSKSKRQKVFVLFIIVRSVSSVLGSSYSLNRSDCWLVDEFWKLIRKVMRTRQNAHSDLFVCCVYWSNWFRAYLHDIKERRLKTFLRIIIFLIKNLYKTYILTINRKNLLAILLVKSEKFEHSYEEG